MKNIILMIILIGIVVISNAVKMKIKSNEIIIQSEHDISADYMQISATFLSSTNDLMPVQDLQANAFSNLRVD